MPRTSLLLLILVCASVSAADRLYKWVDANGKVQYSDKPPMQPAEKGMTEINSRGMVVKQIEGALTPEQKAERAALLEQKKLDEQKMVEAKRRDRALTDSFNNVREIDAIRDRNLEQVQASIKSDQQRLDATNHRLDVFEKQVATMEAKKKKVPDDLRADIDGTKTEAAKLAGNMKKKQDEIQQIKDKAEADKQRLVELKGPSAK